MKKISLVTAALACAGLAAGTYFALETQPRSSEAIAAEGTSRRTQAEATGDGVKVEVVKPEKGGIERTTIQPGTVESFESARLYSKVSGYLLKQSIDGEDVDIGTRVKKGDVLAVIDMPELQQDLERDEAAVEQAQAHVVQMEAAVESARADYDAAVALVGEREANVEHAQATLNYRGKQFKRMKNLLADRAIDEKLVDESEDFYEAAQAGMSSAKASVVSAQAQATSFKVKIAQAEANLINAKAMVSVAQATVQRDKVFLEYTNIRSPYDGVVTFRGFHLGDFINARDQGANVPVLTVDRTDKMRVVLQVPDLDVPFVNAGDKAIVMIDALPGRKFEGKVARVSNSEDQQTRTMRTEVDLENDKNLLRDGMYGKVTISLEKASDALTVPSSAMAGESHGGKAPLYVVRGGKAHKVEVGVGADDGRKVEVISGLNPDDDVVVRPSGAIANGVSVAVVNR